MNYRRSCSLELQGVVHQAVIYGDPCIDDAYRRPQLIFSKGETDEVRRTIEEQFNMAYELYCNCEYSFASLGEELREDWAETALTGEDTIEETLAYGENAFSMLYSLNCLMHLVNSFLLKGAVDFYSYPYPEEIMDLIVGAIETFFLKYKSLSGYELLYNEYRIDGGGINFDSFDVFGSEEDCASVKNLASCDESDRGGEEADEGGILYLIFGDEKDVLPDGVYSLSDLLEKRRVFVMKCAMAAVSRAITDYRETLENSRPAKPREKYALSAFMQ